MNMTGLHKSSKARTGKKMNWSSFLGFLAFDFYRFCVVICFFIPATTANDLGLQRISIPDFIHYIFFPILILQKEPVFPFFNVECLTRELLVPFLYRLLYHAVLDWELNPGPPTLEAGTPPLGYRVGGGWLSTGSVIQELS